MFRKQTSLRDKHVFVTGAASGIGRATALAAAREHASLYLTDRDADGLAETVRLIETEGGSAPFARAVDITDFDAVRALATDLTTEYGAMDVVMNIAGISAWGSVQTLTHQHWRSMVEVNLMGPIHVIETLVPPMIDAGRGGHLVNVSSAAGIIGMPWHAAYSASKFGLRGVSEVLRFDLARYRIGVSLVCPGAVATPLTETVEIAGVDKTSKRFRQLQAGFRRGAVSPEQAADAILTGVRRNRYWVYTSTDIRLVHLLQRYLPPAYWLLMTAFNRGANRALPDVAAAGRKVRRPVSSGLTSEASASEPAEEGR